MFIKEVDTELAKPLEEGDYEALVNVIGILLRIKERQIATDEMFEPLKQAIELLKIYNQDLPDEVHQHLQVRIYFVQALCFQMPRPKLTLSSIRQRTCFAVLIICGYLGLVLGLSGIYKTGYPTGIETGTRYLGTRSEHYLGHLALGELKKTISQ